MLSISFENNFWSDLWSDYWWLIFLVPLILLLLKSFFEWFRYNWDLILIFSFILAAIGGVVSLFIFWSWQYMLFILLVFIALTITTYIHIIATDTINFEEWIMYSFGWIPTTIILVIAGTVAASLWWIWWAAVLVGIGGFILIVGLNVLSIFLKNKPYYIYYYQQDEYANDESSSDIVDHYESLRVRYDASQEEIKESYRRLAKKYHPDSSNTTTAEEFIKIQEAYDVLKNFEKKKEYDLKLFKDVK